MNPEMNKQMNERTYNEQTNKQTNMNKQTDKLDYLGRLIVKVTISLPLAFLHQTNRRANY